MAGMTDSVLEKTRFPDRLSLSLNSGTLFANMGAFLRSAYTRVSERFGSVCVISFGTRVYLRSTADRWTNEH